MRELIFLSTIGGIYMSMLWSPGPNFVVLSKAAMSESRRHGIYTALGISSGTAVWTILAATGVGLVFSHFESARHAMQILGGAYLLYMGVKMWRNAGRAVSQCAADTAGRSLAQAYWRGLATCLTNPQSLAFFTSIFATLFAQDMPPWLKLAGVALIIVLSVTCYQIQATLFSTARVRRGYLGAKRWIDRIAGGLIALFGLRLLLG